MAEENVFFMPVRNICRRDVATCSPDDSLVEMAALMRERRISSLVVCRDDEPLGIFTDRDLRNKVVAAGRNPADLQVGEIMNSPLITVREEDFLFEVLYRMSRHDIHRVCVVEEDGRLCGIITDSDILHLQLRSPQKMLRDIEQAETMEDLGFLHRQIQDLVVHLVDTRVATADLVRMIAHLNDRLQIRLISLLRETRFPDLTDRFAFLVLGSEGRREQTLTTDQDNAIVYADDVSGKELKQIEDFSQALIEALVEMGVPPCPGKIMANNPFWRRSLSQWTTVVDNWMSTPIWENILNGSMFFDLRTLHGDRSFEEKLKSHLESHLADDDVFLARTAINTLGFKPPIGLFGRLKTEKKGEHHGELDIKKAGIFAITEGIKVLALEAGMLPGGTRERLQILLERGLLKQQQARDLKASYDFLVHLRLRNQVRAIHEGREPNNFISLDHLNRMEKGRLKLALKEVKFFQNYLERHFQTHLIS